MRIDLPAPPGFQFRRTVFSHGWCRLDPFEVADDGHRLETVVEVDRGRARLLRLEGTGHRVTLESPGTPSSEERTALIRAARRVLNLDLDLEPFYRTVRAEPGFAWIADRGAGRMLRGATAFEDLLKLVLTTNCSWALTTRMTATITGWGPVAEGTRRAFPSAIALRDVTEADLRRVARLGYRAPFVVRLISDVVAGVTDPESWQADPRPASELRRELMRLPGVGPYVAENLLRFSGRPQGLALDSWLREKFARVYHGGRRVSDRTIARRYARFGSWAGLALWCDMTRDWLEDDAPSGAWERLA